ncbi:MAG: hypothetical protein JO100_04905 [Pseudonocardia sp.]|nr:hypothetical protein [Pseudonocardia sp.]
MFLSRPMAAEAQSQYLRSAAVRGGRFSEGTIRLDAVTKVYRTSTVYRTGTVEVQALNSVDLVIEPGELASPKLVGAMS